MSTTTFKPEGYNSVSPYLIVSGASATIAFLQRTFDAVELRRFPDADGSCSTPRCASTIRS